MVFGITLPDMGEGGAKWLIISELQAFCELVKRLAVQPKVICPLVIVIITGAKVTLYFETAKLFEKKFRTQIQLVNATFWKYSLEQAYKNKEERK